MEQQYRVTIEFSVVSKHDIDYMKEHMDVCMLKYGVSEIIPEGEKQEASLE